VLGHTHFGCESALRIQSHGREGRRVAWRRGDRTPAMGVPELSGPLSRAASAGCGPYHAAILDRRYSERAPTTEHSCESANVVQRHNAGTHASTRSQLLFSVRPRLESRQSPGGDTSELRPGACRFAPSRVEQSRGC